MKNPILIHKIWQEVQKNVKFLIVSHIGSPLYINNKLPI